MQSEYTASRKLRNGNTLTVTYIGSSRSDHKVAFHLDVDMSKVKKPTRVTGNYLPGRFKVEGLPFSVEFVVDVWKPANYATTNKGAEMRITEMHITEMQNSLGLTSHDLPVDELRRLAIQASSFLAVVSPRTKAEAFGKDFNILGHVSTPRKTVEAFAGAPKLEGKELYEAIGKLHQATPQGMKQQVIAAHFGYGIDWAQKHIRLGKQLYPKLFKQDNSGTNKKPTKRNTKGKTK